MKVGMIGWWRPVENPEEIDHRYLALHRLAGPPVVGCGRVRAHEGILDDIVRIYLPMRLFLVVIPIPCTLPRENGLDAQEPGHFTGFKDPSLRVDLRRQMAVPKTVKRFPPNRWITLLKTWADRGRIVVDLGSFQLFA
jgi:hypothetical protein